MSYLSSSDWREYAVTSTSTSTASTGLPPIDSISISPSTTSSGYIYRDSGWTSASAISTPSFTSTVSVADVGDLEYHGHKLKDVEVAFDQVNHANQLIKRWALEGVNNLGGLREVPRALTRIMLGAVAKIAMYKSTLNVAFDFEQQVKLSGLDCEFKKKSMDRPAFMMALAYEALGFGFTDIDDVDVAEVFRVLHCHKDVLSEEVKERIAEIEKRAVRT